MGGRVSHQVIPLPLPSPILTVTWHIVIPEFEKSSSHYQALKSAFLDTCRRPGWNPKTVQMGRVLRAIDYCADHETGAFHSFLTALVVDHPFLAALPANAPRAVRHPYKADVRLKYAVAREGWDYLGDMRRAEEAAEAFNLATARLRQ